MNLPDLLARELANVIGALVGAEAQSEPCEAVAEWHHVVEIAFGGRTSGTVTFGLDREAASTLSRLVMGLDEEPPEPAILDTLKEVCGQAVATLSQHAEFQDARVSGSVVGGPRPESVPTCLRITAGAQLSAVVGIWAVLDVTASSPAPAVSVSRIAPAPANLDLILDIDLPLAVRFGETEMTLKRLTRLAPGSVIDLGRSPDDPVDVLVNGRLIARGEVVVVAGNYGVRVTEVLSAADRLRTVSL